jgi:hypothetical protein
LDLDAASAAESAAACIAVLTACAAVIDAGTDQPMIGTIDKANNGTTLACRSLIKRWSNMAQGHGLLNLAPSLQPPFS